MSDFSDNEADAQSHRYRVLATICLLAVIAYIQRGAMSVPAVEISEDLKFANLARDMGWIQSAWYFGYAVMQLPSGWFADRIGSRHALSVLCFAWSCVMLFSGLATGFVSLLILWGLMGAAQAGVFPCATKAIGQIFPDTERARASGLLGSGMAIGGALAPILAALLLKALTPISQSMQTDSWRLLFAAYAICGLLWTLLFLRTVPAAQLPRTQRAGVSSQVDWTRIFRSPPMLLLCAQQFLRAACMVFFLTWFPTFLQKTRGVSSLESGILTTVVGIGAVLGSLTGGFVSDWMLRRTGNSRLSRQGIAVAGIGSCALLILASYFIADVQTSIAVISLGGFCAAFGGVSGYTVAITFGGKHVATVFASMNMCGNFGASLFPITAGWLVAKTGNWNLILFLFAAAMVVDAICWVFLNPRGTLFGDDDTSPISTAS